MNYQVIYTSYDENTYNVSISRGRHWCSVFFDLRIWRIQLYMYGFSTFLVQLCTAGMCIWHLWILGIFGWKMVSQPTPPRWHCTPTSSPEMEFMKVQFLWDLPFYKMLFMNKLEFSSLTDCFVWILKQKGCRPVGVVWFSSFNAFIIVVSMRKRSIYA